MDSSNNNSGAVAPQWQLNETANSAIAIARGVLMAATSDNVQPLAIIAADAFGATLAMCRETQMKVEQAARKGHTSYVIEFLKSKIGYAKDDCAVQLCSSSTGIRFLGLAAALLCTTDTFTASRALELMITSSAARSQILPTTIQLRDLLAALEHKMNRTEFAKNVLGWEIFLEEHPEVPDELRVSSQLAVDHPPIEGLQALVDGFRTLDRVGNTTSLRITAGTCAPWVIAFVKWCLGEPPNIVLDDGTVLIGQPHARVTVTAVMKPMKPQTWDLNSKSWATQVMSEARETEFAIAIYRDLKNPSQLFTFPGRDQKPWFGMVPAEMYARNRLRQYDLLENWAFYQAMSYSIKRVTSNIEIKYPLDAPTSALSLNTLALEPAEGGSSSKYKTAVFPPDFELKDALNKYLNHANTPNAVLANLEHGQDVYHLPLVGTHLKMLGSDCTCKDCSGDHSQVTQWCLKHAFADVLASITAEVIALSLFDTTEPVLIYAGGARVPGATILGRNPFVAAVRDILSGKAASCTIGDILVLALDMVGHDAEVELAQTRWIASEARGQVVFPMIFDAGSFDAEGILKLGGAPGKIFHNGSSFKMVLGGTAQQDAPPASRLWTETPVDSIVNLIPLEQIAWQVTEGDNILNLACGTTNTPKVFNPFEILLALAQSAFLPRCLHGEKSTLRPPDAHSFYITPLCGVYDRAAVPGRLAVVAVAGNEGLRLFSAWLRFRYRKQTLLRREMGAALEAPVRLACITS